MGKLFNLDNPVMKKLAVALDFFLLNFLFIVTSLPVVTFFGNCISLYDVYRKYLGGEKSALLGRYLKQMKANFIIGLKLFAVFGSVGFLMIFSFFATFNLSGFILLYSRICVLLVLFLLVTTVNSSLIYYSKYTDSLRKGIENAFHIGIRSWRVLLSSFLLFVLLLGFIRADILLTFIYICSFGGMSLITFYNYKFLVHDYKKYEQ